MLKLGKKLVIIALLIVAGFAVANFTMAAGLETGIEYGEEIGLGDEDPRLIVANIIRIALGFLGVIGVGLIMYAGWLYMSANGEVEKVDKAKKLLTAAIIGLVIILSAFGIASFILSRILDATGGSPGGGSSNPSGYYPGGGNPWSNAFYVSSTVPVDGSSGVVRNVRVRFNYNKSISDSTVTNSSFTITDSSGDVSGNINVSGKIIEFIPSGSCPTNSCNANSCFAENNTITVSVNNGPSGVLSTNGVETDCVSGEPCSITFMTGTSIDCEEPTANLYFNSGQVCVNTNNEIFASASDDSGISNIEFFENSTSFDDKVNPSGANPFNISTFWDGTGHTVGTNKDFSISAYDLAFNSVSDNETLSLRSEHCCNGILDEDEQELDCGGSDCAACSGSACADDISSPASCSNSICSSNFCSSSGSDAASCALAGYLDGVDECCLCSNNPRIDALSPLGGFCDGNYDTVCTENSDCSAFSPSTCNIDTPNAKVGNFITISGKYFGDSIGEVYFTGASGWVLASLPSTVNSNCTSNWSDDEIIVVVPSGATEGPIKVKNIIDGLEDSTDDANGASIKDFLKNNITRPGVCKLNPNGGVTDDTLTYYGINFENNNRVYFGDYNSQNVEGVNTSFVDSNTLNSDVPNIAMGLVTSYILNSNNTPSNYIDFKKEEEPLSGPSIISFEPSVGNIGQYITINGSGFGNSQSTSNVYFNYTNDVKASYVFPDVCNDSFWSDKQVIVKVPSGLTDGEYTITMVVGANVTDTSAINPNKFKVDSASTLSPSLCKIEPTMGSANSEISLWGEYFGSFNSTNSKVRFHLNHDYYGSYINSWELDDSDSGVDPFKIVTTIHQDAVSGGVSVAIGSPEVVGNSLNLEVGLCSNDSDCGSQMCCPSSSIEEGRCMDTINDCYSSVASSVYEWDFSTGASQTAISSSTDSCIALSRASGSCDSVACPNSPGKCSLGEVIFNSPCGDSYCNTTFSSECNGKCAFDNSFSRCVASGDLTTSCSIYEGDTISVGGNEIDLPSGYTSAECKQLGTKNYWQINPNLLSCPNTNWELNINGWCTLVNPSASPSTPQECNVCGSGFDCRNEGSIDNMGKCFVGGQVCSSGVDCVDNVCDAPALDQCECCCRIDNAGQDCCASLTCAGSCGSDAVVVAAGGTDPEIYGTCSGCRIDSNGDGSINSAEQALSDQACNCSTSSGKYCDVNADVNGDGSPEGACRDCNQLPTTGSCSTHHATCCVDAMDSSNCKGETGYQGLENAPNSTDYFCGYFKCDDDLAEGCYGTSPDYTKIADKGSYIGDVYSAISECENQCQDGGGPGMSCYDTVQQACSLTCKTGYECIGQDGCSSSGSACDADDGSCACCCDPGDDSVSPPIEPQINAYGLTCRENISPCDGDSRGLYCGCSEDLECGSGGIAGCGNDTCCRPRPSIIDESESDNTNGCVDNVNVGDGVFETCLNDPVPADGATGVCRNALISATFDQKMDINSFTGNMLVVGDYGTSACPSGTQYIASDSIAPRSRIVKIIDSISSKFKSFVKIFSKNSKQAIAYTSPVPANHYCAVPGTALGEHIGDDKTIIKFSPSEALEENIKYYVIIKGDGNLDSSNGVLSDWDVGYNGPNTEMFNGITYNNSMIWAFRAGSDVCSLNSVTINPNSKLFQKVAQSQVFTASAKSNNNQAIVPISGAYNWRMDWSIDNESVVKFSGGSAVANSNSQTIISQNKEDAKTYIFAKATITEDTVSTSSSVGEEKIGKASAYVFLCQNPWPAVNSSGVWSPWRDELNGMNCLASTGTCSNTNYELYYCRDNGTSSTVDDIPALKSDSGDVVVRGSSLSLACTDSTVSTCSSYGAICGTGVCEYSNDILKETYFFRESIPTATATDNIISLDAANETTGGKITLKWCPTNYLNSTDSTYLSDIENYNVYYSTSPNININSGIATQLTGVLATPLASMSIPSELSGLNCHSSGAYEYTVNGLSDDTNYYFRVKAINSLSVESDFSNEDIASPSDVIAPSISVLTDVLVGELNSAVKVKWTPVVGASEYTLSYSSGNCSTVGTSFASNIMINASSNSSAFNSSEFLVTSTDSYTLVNGLNYCFAIKAADSSGNYSAYSSGVNVIPFSNLVLNSSGTGFSIIDLTATPLDNEVNLTWNKNVGVKGYRIIVVPGSMSSTTSVFPSSYGASSYPDIEESTICTGGVCNYKVVNGTAGTSCTSAQIINTGTGVGQSACVENGVALRFFVQAYQDCWRSSASGTCHSVLSNPSTEIFPLYTVTDLSVTTNVNNISLEWVNNSNDSIPGSIVNIYYKNGASANYNDNDNPNFVIATGSHTPTVSLPSVAGDYNLIIKTMYCRDGECYYSDASNEVTATVLVP